LKWGNNRTVTEKYNTEDPIIPLMFWENNARENDVWKSVLTWWGNNRTVIEKKKNTEDLIIPLIFWENNARENDVWKGVLT